MQTRHHRLIITVVWCIVALAILAIAGHLLATFGTAGKRNLVFAGVVGLLPVLIYLAVTRPFLFPFSLFVVLVPFDNLLRLDPRFGTLTKLVAVASVAAFLFWLVRKRQFVKPSASTILWLTMLVWMTLSLSWALDSTQAASKLATYAQLIGLYVVIALMPVSLKDYKLLLSAIVVGGLAAAAYIVYLYHTGAFVQYANINGALTSRLLVQFGDEKLAPDELSAALLLPTALIMMWALRARWSLAKLGLIGMFLLLVAGMYVNGSRGGLVALAVMILYMLWRSRFKTQLITLSVAAFAASFLMPQSPWLRFANAASTGGAGRVSIWKVGFAAFKHHWLTGAGVGNFAFAYDQSFIKVFQKYYANWHRAPHNVILEFSVELGLVGVVLFLAAWYTQWRSLRSITPGHPSYDMRITLEAAVVALFVAGIFVGTMSGKYTWLLFELMAVMSTTALLQRPAPTGLVVLAPESPQQILPITPQKPRKPINA